jgi:hypothetical protein
MKKQATAARFEPSRAYLYNTEMFDSAFHFLVYISEKASFFYFSEVNPSNGWILDGGHGGDM